MEVSVIKLFEETFICIKKRRTCPYADIACEDGSRKLSYDDDLYLNVKTITSFIDNDHSDIKTFTINSTERNPICFYNFLSINNLKDTSKVYIESNDYTIIKNFIEGYGKLI